MNSLHIVARLYKPCSQLLAGAQRNATCAWYIIDNRREISVLHLDDNKNWWVGWATQQNAV